VADGDVADGDINALTAIEGQLRLRRVFGRSFVRIERWLIADRAILARMAPRPWRRGELPRLDMSLRDWWRARRTGGNSRLALSCCALYEGRGTRRSYYLSRGLTIKLFPPGASPERVRKDIDARTLVAASGRLNVPKVLISDVTSDRIFIVEELIAGHHPTAAQKQQILEALVPEIWATYQAVGFGVTETFPDLTVETVEYELERAQIPEQMAYERGCRDELLGRLRQLPSTAERPLVTAFGHGDLSTGNIIATDSGDLFVIDWETSGRMPVVWDLRKLMPAIPGLLSKIIQLLGAELQHLGWRDAMAPEHQCLLGLGARIAERSRKAHRRGHALADHKTLRELRRAGDLLRSGAL
jgi:hypothetical protein